MHNFNIVEQRNIQGALIGWSIHPIEQHLQAHIYLLNETAEVVAILQRDAEGALLETSSPPEPTITK